MADRKFMVISPDGSSFDNSGEECNNLQILDIIQADSFEQAEAVAKRNNYGDFPHWQVVEYLTPEKITDKDYKQPEKYDGQGELSVKEEHHAGQCHCGHHHEDENMFDIDVLPAELEEEFGK